jgi:predicted nucleic acid-binding protein
MLVYVDTNVFIEVYETGGPLQPALRLLFQAAADPLLSLITSELTLAELSVEPIRHGRLDRLNAYRELIAEKGSMIRAVPVHRMIFDEAASCRAKSPALRLPDAIHLATAITEQCNVLITNDKRFLNTGVQSNLRLIGFEADMITSLIPSTSRP